MKNYLMASMLLTSGLAFGSAYGQAACSSLPTGASALGFTTQVFNDSPTLEDVSSTDEDSKSKWYPGSFDKTVAANLATRRLLSTHDGVLAVGLGSSVNSETHNSTQGGLPLLSGSKGFYVEFSMNLSSNNSDHFTGMYLETVEHNHDKSDHLSSDPAGVERWTEIDVSEAGYGQGSLGTFIEWSGAYPHYSSKVWNDYGVDSKIDWTTEHRYGLSFDPASDVLTWYVDDKKIWSKSASGSVIKNFHYYLVIEASSHGSHIPYEMYIHNVRAYTK